MAAFRRADAVLNADSRASGGGTADYRVMCDPAGQISVGRVVTESPEFDDIVAAAREAGYRSQGADYTIFFDGGPGDSCGISSYALDQRLSPDNASALGGNYAVVYAGCWYDEALMHEIGHSQGAVQPDAPNSTGSGGHCFDEADVMCYSPDGGDRHQEGVVSRCADRVHFDCGHDDYFDTAPEPGEYLATHWNLGSPLNPFIAFGPGPAGGDSRALRLRRGEPRMGSAAGLGGWRRFRIRVPGGSSRLRISLHGPTCAAITCEADLDLYLRRGAPPTAGSYARRVRRDGATKRVRVRRPRRGAWYAGVRTASGLEGAAFRITASD